MHSIACWTRSHDYCDGAAVKKRYSVYQLMSRFIDKHAKLCACTWIPYFSLSLSLSLSLSHWQFVMRYSANRKENHTSFHFLYCPFSRFLGKHLCSQIQYWVWTVNRCHGKSHSCRCSSDRLHFSYLGYSYLIAIYNCSTIIIPHIPSMTQSVSGLNCTAAQLAQGQECLAFSRLPTKSSWASGNKVKTNDLSLILSPMKYQISDLMFPLLILLVSNISLTGLNYF